VSTYYHSEAPTKRNVITGRDRMPAERILSVQVQEDFVEKLAAAQPAQALAELIWNGLDAEATKVTVGAERGPLGLTAVRIRDNGHGILPEEVEALFTNIGGSWKRNARESKNGKRMLHGEEGKGRFRALALGRVAEWLVTSLDASGQLVRYQITVIKDNARSVRISEAEPAETGMACGVEVTVKELYKDWDLEAAGVLQELNERYAIYLTDYPEVTVSLLGARLDPTTLIDVRRTFALASIPDGNDSIPAELEVVEWKTSTDRMLYLCSAAGFPLHRISPGIQAPGFEFCSYLRSRYVTVLHEQGALDLAEMDPRLNQSVEDAKDQLRNHFKARAIEKQRTMVDEWKSEQIYPYRDAPATPVQVAERQVFEIVAVNVANSLPDFQTQSQRHRKFQLRMLKQAIERGPEELQLILGEVLDLGQRKQEELAKLLQRTTLSAIISAAKMVADRLDFLDGLEAMLFETGLKKHFKERAQLHQLLAENTWVFGEEFALAANDQSLTEVLRQTLKAANREIIVDEPVKRSDGRAGRVDLMLTRRVPTARESERDHLVIELKAPKVVIGMAETSQIKSYAFTVQDDERFRGVPARWTFWLVSNDMDPYAKNEVRQADRPEGVLWQSSDLRSRIWVKTWSQLIHENKSRLKIFQKELNRTADRDASLGYLKKTYARILQGIDLPEPAGEVDADEATSSPAVSN
jgi:hypothetical protein